MTEVHVQTMEGQVGENVRKRKRRKLLGKICRQMEFYFGDSNLAKDKYLSARISEDPNGYVDVDLFLKFNKIRALTSSVQDIIDALASSEILEIAPDGQRLQRKRPVERTNFDNCTIYVEKLPPHADHKWLRDIFNHFGNVTHTSIPHFRASKKAKGFAFVEFESPECVVKACKHFKTSTESGESDTGEESDDPKDKKSSGKTKKSQGHYKEHQSAKGKDGPPHRANKKRKRNESEGSERLGSHCRSIENEDVDGRLTMQSEVNGRNEVVDTNRSASELESCDERNEGKYIGTRDHPEAVEIKSDVGGSPLKSGRKRRRRDTDNEGTPKKVKYEHQVSVSSDTGETSKQQKSGSDSESKCAGDARIKVEEGSNKHPMHETDGKDPSTTVVSGTTAGKDDQVEEMAAELSIKMENVVSDSNFPLSKRQKKRRRKKKNKSDDDKPHLRVLTKAEWKTYRNKYLSLQRASMVQVKKMLGLDNQQGHFEGDIEEDNYEESPIKEDKPIYEGITFQPGVIVKIKLSEPVENCQKLIKQVKSCADVSYVDAPEGSSQVYVRCPDPEVASTIMGEGRFAKIGDAEIAKADEETAYWEKILADRDVKFKSKIKHKKRGRDKLISKATKMLGTNTHVHFDD